MRGLVGAARLPRRAPGWLLRWLLVVGSLLLAGASGGQAETPLPFAISVHASPRTLRYPAQKAYLLTYTITTTDQPATAFISQDVGSWEAPWIAGWPLEYGQPSLTGNGTLSPTARVVADYAAGACLRGSDEELGTIEVSLPAASTATLTVPVRIAAPPWPHMRVKPHISISASHDSPGIPLAAPPLRLTGRTGVRIRLHARLPKRNIVVIRGSTSPVVSRAVFRVAAFDFHTGREVLVGFVRSARNGRFRTKSWRFPDKGPFQFFASYNHPRPGLIADRGCLPGLWGPTRSSHLLR